MQYINVIQFLGKSGNPVDNQFIIYTAEGMYFQSYNVLIAFKPFRREPNKASIYLDSTYWNYSKTTGKYRNIFLGESKAETEQKIKEGKYALIDLNKK